MTTAVLMGGTAGEREVSLRSGAAVLAALRRQGVPAVGVTLDHEDLRDMPAEVDVAVLALHGGFGEDGRIQRLLDARGIPYTGSGPDASALAMDKLAARSAFRRAGLAVATAVPLAPGAPAGAVLDAVGLPCVVKPRSEGSSLGVSLVRRAAELPEALERAWAFGREALVERFVPGTELTVAVLDGEALPLVEVLPADDFFSYDAKYGGRGTVYCVNPPLPPAVAREAAAAGVAAYRALGCRHYARVDCIVRHTGVPVILEVNTLPGMTGTSLFPMAAGAAGLDFDHLCLRMLELARSTATVGRRDAA